ncbi:hypothetical protein [Agromyces mangrovi Wang et al. 2018]|uniref:hypothetical protein n=1 Tax=Agromyces mangrovi TaxID=1858653 RepID=UPI0025746D1E|nr:hypothetical protein [Agromyces mangrovi]BDZ63261.1 hypothetical protein GCM10025877_01990 [Agromyces mangrovi]
MHRYLPDAGDWLVDVGERHVLAVRGERARALLLGRPDGGHAAGDVLEALTAQGLGATPSFLLVSAERGRMPRPSA